MGNCCCMACACGLRDFSQNPSLLFFSIIMARRMGGKRASSRRNKESTSKSRCQTGLKRKLASSISEDDEDNDVFQGDGFDADGTDVNDREQLSERTRKRTNVECRETTSREAVGAEEEPPESDMESDDDEEANDVGADADPMVDDGCQQTGQGTNSTTVPKTVVAKQGSGGSVVSSRITSSLTGDQSLVSFSTSAGSVSGSSVPVNAANAHKFGSVKSAVRKTVFRYIKFLGKSSSRELEWDNTIASIVYSHLNMNGMSRENKKAWWEADNRAVAKWVAETLSAKRSEVTQSIHRRFLGKLSG